MYRGLRVAVVIPAHNEAQLLPVTLRGLPDYLDEVIVIDDASEDETAQLALQDPRPLHLLKHPENRGVGAAIISGYRESLSLGVEVVVVVGADAQMDPEEMSRLLDPLVEDRADYTKGDRLGHPELLQRMPWIRLLGNLILSRWTALSTGYRGLRDAQCGYTALHTNTLAQLPLSAIYPRYGFPNDLLAKLSEVGARVQSCPVTPIYGEERSGLRILRVIGPISWLLLRNTLKRWWRGPKLLTTSDEPSTL